jgi:uncharacterized damage-inducible protein DinB
MDPQICRTLARYNRWMNEKLYAICQGFSDEERKLDRGAPFASMHGTLNHLLLADRIWMGLFRGEPYPAQSLGQELYSDFTELRAARADQDAEIETWIGSLSAEALQGTLRFRPISTPVEREGPLWFCLTHFFNHQTHHRGQLTALIEAAGGDCGVTDLLRLPDSPMRLIQADEE